MLARPAAVDAKTALADVRLGFVKPTSLPAGATVTIELVVDAHASAIVIPAVAVIHDGDETFVMVAGADNQAHKKAVKTGLAAGDAIEILSGIAAGDLVITHGQDELPDNAAITVSK